MNAKLKTTATGKPAITTNEINALLAVEKAASDAANFRCSDPLKAIKSALANLAAIRELNKI